MSANKKQQDDKSKQNAQQENKSQEEEEDPLSKKWDKCAYSIVKNTGIGLLIGLVGSCMLGSKKTAFGGGLGFGWGMSYGDCVIELNKKDESPKTEKPKQTKYKLFNP